VREEGSLKGYRKIHAVLAQIPDTPLGVDWSISVTGTDDRFISMLRQQRKSAMPLMTRVYFSGDMLHGRHVEEAYIYRLTGKATMNAYVDIGEMIDRLVPIWRRGMTHLLFFNQLQTSHAHEKDIWLQSETFYEYTLQAHLLMAFSDAATLFEGDRYRSSRNESANIYYLLRAAQSTKRFPYATKKEVQKRIADYDKRFVTDDRLLFSIHATPQNESDLDAGSVPNELRQEFEYDGQPLSQDVTVVKEDNRWRIHDGADPYKLIYTVRKNNGQLNVYEALENAIKRLKKWRDNVLAHPPKKSVEGRFSNIAQRLSDLFDLAGEILNTFSAYWRGSKMEFQADLPDFADFADLAQRGLQFDKRLE
jgi:hypothetical protein